MAVRFMFDNQLLRTWLLLHQTYSLLVKAEDSVFAKVGLTTQHHAVLIAMKYLESPVKPSDIAHWLDRNTNTITTLLDRMEKDGLIKRVRDLRDRRSIRLVMTETGEKALNQATALAWPLVQGILQELSEDEMRTLGNLLEKVRGKAFNHLNPRKVIKEVNVVDEPERMARFLTKVNKYRAKS